jgi:hypothetical protein
LVCASFLNCSVFAFRETLSRRFNHQAIQSILTWQNARTRRRALSACNAPIQMPAVAAALKVVSNFLVRSLGL